MSVDKKSKKIPASRATKGGDRPGAGRPKGAKNKVTVELQEAAQLYTQAALDTLYKVCTKGESESARVAAACALLDRGHGKPKQAVVGDPNAPIQHEVRGVAWMTEAEAKARGWA